ncbi:MAG: tyrosine-type recombinase/integrase [Chloroflexi bacterium]|nr:tyrosine-type recombinase/integrase [Chloroflexota bacterium]
MTTPPRLAALLQTFFTDRLLQQRRASPHTIGGYRDSFRLLLRYAKSELGKEPSDLLLMDLDVHFISRFLQHIEIERGNSPRTRNVRLAAVHSFFRYVAICEPQAVFLCQQILAIPSKRYDRKPIEYLTRAEIDALVGAPDSNTWLGRRDQALLLVAIQTGLRVSELIGLRRVDVDLQTGAHVRCQGKGRKLRSTPLRPEAIALMKRWLKALPANPETPVFPSRRGTILSRDAVERLVARHCKTAQQHCTSFRNKHVTPHVLRHTAAMELLKSGVDRSVIALWLGHESMETTQIYLHADMGMKEKALSAVTPTGVKPPRFKPGDALLAFLEAL